MMRKSRFAPWPGSSGEVSWVKPTPPDGSINATMAAVSGGASFSALGSVLVGAALNAVASGASFGGLSAVLLSATIAAQSQAASFSGAATVVSAGSAPSAAVGVFSTANYWSRTATTDLVASRTIILIGNKRADSGNQTFWGCCASARGWFLNSSGGASGKLELFLRGGANPSYTISNTLPNGYFCLALTVTAGGAVRASLNGLAVVQPTASPAYVANDGTSIETIGRVNAAVNTFACVQSDIVAVAYLTRAASDAELQAWGGQIVATDSFQMHANVRSDASLAYELHFSRDWDGLAASAVSGLGSAPATFAKQGTGGTKNAIPSFTTYAFSSAGQLNNNQTWDTTTFPGAVNTYEFACSRFSTDATWVRVDVSPRNNGVPNDSERIGFSVNDVLQATRIMVAGFDAPQTIDFSGLAASAKTLEATANYRELDGGTDDAGNGIAVTGIRVPTANAVTFLNPAKTQRILVVGNSMTGKVAAGLGTVTGSVAQSWVMLARQHVRASGVAGWTNADLTTEGWGGRSWHQFIADSTKRAAAVARHVACLNGTAKNVVWWSLDINDYIRNTYTSLATFEADLGAYLDAFKTAADAAGVPGLVCYLQTSNPKTSETAVGGHTAGDYRTSVTNVGSSRAWLTVVSGPSLTSTADLGDGLHFGVSGHVTQESAFRTIVGY